MGIFTQEMVIERLQQKLALQKKDGEQDLQVRLYELFRQEQLQYAQRDCLVQYSDTLDWYRLVDRVSNISFLYRVERDERLGKWVHDRVMEIVERPEDDWIGPWFRERNSTWQLGTLESAMITRAVCESCINAPEQFAEKEKQQIREIVRRRGLVLGERFLEKHWEENTPDNWDMQILLGYCTAAVFLGDERKVKRAVEFETWLSSLYNRDSYGESVHYSDYASGNFSSLHRVLLQAGYVRQEELHPECYFRLILWYVYTFQRMKWLEHYHTETARSFAFGDSGNLFRPKADILVQTAIYGKARYPMEASLASWLFSVTYGKEDKWNVEMKKQGFFQSFGPYTILYLPDMAPARSPEACGLDLVKRFEVGHVIARDSWNAPRMQVALAAGYESLQVAAHRHADQNSFQLTLEDERMLVDPGCCCYRLESHKQSRREIAHSNISIRCGGVLLEQRMVEGNVYRPRPVYNRLLACETVGDVTVVISDGTDLYPAPVTRAVRIWLMRLPEFMLVIDEVAAGEPVNLLSRFVANNRDNCLVADDRQKGRLFLKRHGVELDIDVLENLADGQETDLQMVYGWSYLHECQHSLPNQICQGKEGSALVYTLESTREAKNHRRVHLLMPGHRDRMFTPQDCMAQFGVSWEISDDRFTVTAGSDRRVWDISNKKSSQDN